jgi:UTP--glucose-1-phosphate uridylyltransferase
LSVNKAVIPAAGLGTRFLPATKAPPKEMLPVVDKPAIQYVVEEAVRAGIEDILIVTGRGKRSIEDHFDRSFELEHYLEENGDLVRLEEVQRISEMADIHYIRQKDPKGLGHAVLAAEQHVGDHPFAVMLGDDLIAADDLLLESMIAVYDQFGRSVLAVMEVEREAISHYGAIRPEFVEETLARAVDIVEKPAPDVAPSNLAVLGRYVLTPEIFSALKDTPPDRKGEIQLTDGLRRLISQQAVYAKVFEGRRYDIGNKLDYLRATVELACEREDLAPEFRAFLADFALRERLV